MRKLLLLLTVLIAAVLPSKATDVSYSIVKNTTISDPVKTSAGDVTITPIFGDDVTSFTVSATRELPIPKGSGLKISAPEGKTITKITFGNGNNEGVYHTRASYMTDQDNNALVAEGDNACWIGNSQTVTLMNTAGGTFSAVRTITVSIEDAFSGPTPVITINPEGTLPLGEAPIIKSVIVKGANLGGDITFTLPQYVTADKEKVTKEEAESENGCEVTFTINPPTSTPTGGMDRFEIVFNSEKAQSVTLVFQGRVTIVPTYTKLADIQANQTFFFEGNVLVTYVDKPGNRFFVEADGQGWCVYTNENEEFNIERLAAGDMLKKFRAHTYTTIANRNMYLLNTKGGNMNGGVTRDSRDNEVTPTTITLAELNEDGAKTYNMLVKLEKLTVPEAEGKTIAATSATGTATNGLTVKQGELTVDRVLGAFAGSDAVGEAAPAGVFNLVGIRLWSSGVLARTKADITIPEPKAAVTLEKSETEPVKINEKTAVATFKVEVENLTADGKITFEGDNASIFSTEPAAVTNETKEVVVYATATSIGTFDGKVSFDFGSEELNKDMTFDLKVAAYDPANLPTVTLDQTKVELNADPSETVTKTIKVTMANCFAPVEIKAVNEGVDNITLSTMSIEPSATPVDVVITYVGTAVAKQQFEFTTKMMEKPVVLDVECDIAIGISKVMADAEGMYRVYNVAGVKLMETANADDLKALEAGLYIINGRKYMLNK